MTELGGRDSFLLLNLVPDVNPFVLAASLQPHTLLLGEENGCIMGAQESSSYSRSASAETVEIPQVKALFQALGVPGAGRSRSSSPEPTVDVPQVTQRLFQLARSGNVAGMNALKHKCKHLPLNVSNAEGQTLLHVAARYGHTDFCAELLRQNLVAKPNPDGQMPKDVALLGGYAECAAVFAGADTPVADEEEDGEYIGTTHKALYTRDDSHPALMGNELGLGFAVILDGKPGKSLYEVTHPSQTPVFGTSRQAAPPTTKHLRLGVGDAA